MKKFLNCLLLSFVGTLFAKESPNISTCAACHGSTGVSVNSMWPTIAGQHARYIEKQLLEFKAGKTRSAEIMLPFVASLTAEEIKALAAYYSKQSHVQAIAPSHRANERGKQLYHMGDRAQHIPACIACHGPTGLGNEHAGFPVISGQHADYLVAQLKLFKEGQRTNDLNSIMRDIASRMTVADMQAVSDYMTQLK